MKEPRLKLDHQKIEGYISDELELDPKKPDDLKKAARKLGVSFNTLNKVLNQFEMEGVTVKVANKIAKGMSCPHKELVKGYYYPDGISSFGLPKIGDHVRTQLDKASELDLKGEYDKARDVCDSLIDEGGRLEPREVALVTVKKAVYYGNAGQHELSLRTLEDVIDKKPGDDQILEWARYHRALAWRRLWELHSERSHFLEQAESEFTELSHEAHWAAAANHQLGAIYQGKREFDKALKCLGLARGIWQKENNHREGFPCRRMARIYIVEKNYKLALEHLFDAACIFSRSGAGRYNDDVKSEFKNLLEVIWQT